MAWGAPQGCRAPGAEKALFLPPVRGKPGAGCPFLRPCPERRGSIPAAASGMRAPRAKGRPFRASACRIFPLNGAGRREPVLAGIRGTAPRGPPSCLCSMKINPAVCPKARALFPCRGAARASARCRGLFRKKLRKALPEKPRAARLPQRGQKAPCGNASPCRAPRRAWRC